MGKKQADLKMEVKTKIAENRVNQIKELAKTNDEILVAAVKLNYSADAPIDIGGVSGQRLRSFLDRIERLESEKKALADDIRDIYAEAKGTGFDPKIIKKCYRLRLMDTNKRKEEQELLELYASALQLELF